MLEGRQAAVSQDAQRLLKHLAIVRVPAAPKAMNPDQVDDVAPHGARAEAIPGAGVLADGKAGSSFNMKRALAKQMPSAPFQLRVACGDVGNRVIPLDIVDELAPVAAHHRVSLRDCLF